MSSHEITKFYFNKRGNEPNEFTCRCGKRRKQDPKRGYGNLMEHVKRVSSVSQVRETNFQHDRTFLQQNLFWVNTDMR